MTFDLIDAAVRRANPVPDPSRLTHTGPALPDVSTMEGHPMELLDHDPAIELRAGDAPPRPDRDRRRSTWAILGLAAAVITLLVTVVYQARNDPEPAAPATSVESSETIPPPQPTLLTDAMHYQALAPGDYRVDTDGDPASTLSATFAAGGERWFALEAGAARDKAGTDDYTIGLLVAEVDRVNAGGCVAEWVDVGRDAEALANALAGMEAIALYEALLPTTAFGWPAYHLTLGIPTCLSGGYAAWSGPTFVERSYNADGDRVATVDLWVLDVNGVGVLVEVSWHADSDVADRIALWDAIGTLEITP